MLKLARALHRFQIAEYLTTSNNPKLSNIMALPSSNLSFKEVVLGGDMSLEGLHTKEDSASLNSTALIGSSTGKILDEQESKETEAADIQYPGTFALMLITIALCLAVFCVSLGMSHRPRTTASSTNKCQTSLSLPPQSQRLPIISKHLMTWAGQHICPYRVPHPILTSGLRYGSAYFLTSCSFQLFFGKLYTFFPIKWVFLIVLGIFELGSLICAVAPTSEALIVGRAVAGVGSSGVFTGAMLIIAHSVPLAKRSVYTAMIASKCSHVRADECRG